MQQQEKVSQEDVSRYVRAREDARTARAAAAVAGQLASLADQTAAAKEALLASIEEVVALRYNLRPGVDSFGVDGTIVRAPLEPKGAPLPAPHLVDSPRATLARPAQTDPPIAPAGGKG